MPRNSIIKRNREKIYDFQSSKHHFWHHHRLCSTKETLIYGRKRYAKENVILYVNGHVHVANVGCIKHVQFSHFYPDKQQLHQLFFKIAILLGTLLQ